MSCAADAISARAARGVPSKSSSEDEWEDGSSAGSLDVEEALEWWGHDQGSTKRDRAESPEVANTCIRCGSEVLLKSDFVAERGVLFCCELAHRDCEEIRDESERDFFVNCCAFCGNSFVLAVDVSALGLDFRCALAGQACEGGAPDLDHTVGAEGRAAAAAASADVGDGAAGAGVLSQQRCSLCGRAFVTQLDLASLGLDFRCSLAGKLCWESTEVPQRPPDSGLEDGLDQKTSVLSLVEQQRLVAKFGSIGRHRESQRALEREHVTRTLRQDGLEVRERFRDNAVVCSRGEKFITINTTLPAGPGTHLSGILGASSRGRLGFGLRKMTKEEAERFVLSNKERGHFKKKVAHAHAKAQGEKVVFETRNSMHQLAHAAVLPASAVR